MKLTKLDKYAHWWVGTRTTWWYEDKNGIVWLIKDRDRRKKIEKKMNIPKRTKESDASLPLRFYFYLSAACAVGVIAAVLISKYLLL